MRALTSLFAGVQSEFAAWYRNDDTSPVTIDDVGSLSYFTEDSLVTMTETSRTAGWVVAVRSTPADQVYLTPAQVQFSFGRREPPRQGNYGSGGRVVFRPGDDAGNAGALKNARKTSDNPRPLADWIERFTLFVWAHDAAQPADQAAQYEAAKRLFELVFAALYRNAHGRLSVGNPQWIVQTDERSRGAEIRVDCTIRDPQYDVTYDVTTGASASLGLWLNDHLVPEADR